MERRGRWRKTRIHTWIFPLHTVWEDVSGTVLGRTVDQAVGVFYCAVGVKIVASPSRICDDDVSVGGKGDEGEECDCAQV